VSPMGVLKSVLVCWGLSIAAFADDAGEFKGRAILGSGQSFRSQSDVSAYRVAWRQSLRPSVSLGESWSLELEGEASLSGWRANVSQESNHNGGSDQTLVVAAAPVLRLATRGEGSRRVQPFVECGIGVSWFQHKNVASEDGHEGLLGSHLLFEDRLAAGLQFPQLRSLELTFLLLHYSNANLGDTNDGENIRMLSISLPF
jgi:Lipid A 3-O-deacylase (PagL)